MLTENQVEAVGDMLEVATAHIQELEKSEARIFRAALSGILANPRHDYADEGERMRAVSAALEVAKLASAALGGTDGNAR